MRISAKGRYALAAVIHMARQPAGEFITVISISERLGISKIYLEQAFSLLKRGNVVFSVKGAQGGYQLARPPKRITVLDVLSAIELTLFELTESTVADEAPDIEAAMRVAAFDELDRAARQVLGRVTIADLVAEADARRDGDAVMYYI